MRYIMWSGGWDSTYLLCKRARESDETIQPIYINYRHGNEVNERKFKQTLLSLIRAKSDIKAEIREVIEIAEEALPASEAFDAAYEKCGPYIEELYGDHNLFRFFGKAALIFSTPEIGMDSEGTQDYNGITTSADSDSCSRRIICWWIRTETWTA